MPVSSSACTRSPVRLVAAMVRTTTSWLVSVVDATAISGFTHAHMPLENGTDRSVHAWAGLLSGGCVYGERRGIAPPG